MNTQKYILSLLVLVLVNCKQSATNADKILDAQTCLDTSSAAGATECVAKVDGIDSQAADLIRCSGKFVGEGFNDSSKLSAALANISTSGSGATGSTAMIAALAFTSKATESANSTSAQEAFTYCTKAKAKGLILLAGLSQTATVIGQLSATIDLSNPSSITGANLQTAMGTLASDPTAQAAVGNAVVSMYNANCTGTNTTTGNFCQQFSSSIGVVSGGTSNPSGVGAQIMTCYSNPAAAGCTGF